MLLDNVHEGVLVELLAPYMDRPAWPGLTDPAARRRAVRWAKRMGVWDRLSKTLSVPETIPVITLSDYRKWEREGDHRPNSHAFEWRFKQVHDQALGLWLGHPKADLDYFQDLLWAWCDTWTWVIAYHSYSRIDLRASELARMLEEVLWLLGERIDPAVAERVRAEVERRVLAMTWNWREQDAWITSPYNWCLVCNANIIIAALYHFRNHLELAAYLHPVIWRLEYGLGSFADDGGCVEGISYWGYGFGHFVDAALALHHRTNGQLNLLDHDKVRRITRYPVATHVYGPTQAAFGDAHTGWGVDGNVTLKINQIAEAKDLYAVAAARGDGLLNIDGDWQTLCLYRGEKAGGAAGVTGDAYLPDLGQAKLVGGPRDNPSVLVVNAGDNGRPHNHNDIGSFVYFADGRLALTDPGGPIYDDKTFSAHRYENFFCRSLGHSVPVINGREQAPGSRFGGELKVQGPDGDGDKRVIVDMAGAYDDPTLKTLRRELVLHPDGGLALTDHYGFSRRPEAIEEAFVTFEPARATRGGRRVMIGQGARRTALTAGQDGVFTVQKMTQESKQGPSQKLVTRIAFTPAALAAELMLTFHMQQEGRP